MLWTFPLRIVAMAHPSSVVRGKVLTVPVRDLADDTGDLASSLAARIHGLERNRLGRVSVTDRDAAGLSVLVVSGTKQRSLQRWRQVVAPILDARGVHPDWSQALVMLAAASPSHHD